MNLTRKAISALGGITLAAMLIAALAPKVTRGVVATLVQVANTSANPVATIATDNPAHSPIASAGSCTVAGNGLCSGRILTVPQGQTAVIESLTGNCTAGDFSKFSELTLNVQYDSPGGAGGNTVFRLHPVLDMTSLSTMDYSINELTKLYIVSNTFSTGVEGISFDLVFERGQDQTGKLTPATGGCIITANGHFVNNQ